jgi:hypothetical protein
MESSITNTFCFDVLKAAQLNIKICDRQNCDDSHVFARGFIGRYVYHVEIYLSTCSSRRGFFKRLKKIYPRFPLVDIETDTKKDQRCQNRRLSDVVSYSKHVL